MKVYDLLDEQQRTFAFEVNKFLLSRKRICRIISKIPNAKIEERTVSLYEKDEFCEFELDGEKFVVWESWNDSSRFWIGPKNKKYTSKVESIKRFFVSQSRFI